MDEQPFPKRFELRAKLEGTDYFQKFSAFGRTLEQAKERIIERVGPVAEWQD
jgi:hypothetical protein